MDESVREKTLGRLDFFLYLDWRHYLGAVGVIVLGLLGWLGVRAVMYSLTHVQLQGTVAGKVVVASPNLGGRLADLNVTLGQSVKRGDLLARLDAAEPQATVRQAEAALRASAAGAAKSRTQLDLEKVQSGAEIAQAQAESNSAQIGLAQVRKEAEELVRLQRYRVDQAEAALGAARTRLTRAQAGPREQEIRAAQAAVGSAKARLAQAKMRVERLRQLMGRGFVSQQELEQAQADQTVMEGDLEAAQERLSLLQAGTRPEDVEIARQDLAAAEASLKVAENAAVEASLKQLELKKQEQELNRARARLDAARATSGQVNLRTEEFRAARAEQEKTKASLAGASAALAEAVITSPAAGTVTRLPRHVGEVLSPGQEIAVIVSSERMWIEAKLPETVVGRVRPGQPVDVYLEAYPDRRLRGRVELVQQATSSMGGAGQDSGQSSGLTVPEVPIIVSFDYSGVKPLVGMSAHLSILTGRG